MSSSGHKATYTSPSRSIIAVNRWAVFMFKVYMRGRVRITEGLQFRRDLAAVGESRQTASDSGIETHTARSTGQQTWEAFRSYSASSQLFLLYPQSKLFQVVPKRAFPEDQVIEFRRL